MSFSRRSVSHASLLFSFLILAAAAPAGTQGELIARCGQGYLEKVDGHLVLHVKGTPYEMGYQHGTLLKDRIKSMVHYIFEVKGQDDRLEFAGVKLKPKELVKAINAHQQSYIPDRFKEEMQGIADATGIPVADVYAANGIPELFHCSGFALLAETTVDKTVLHGRVLDYAVDWKLQEHPVAMIGEPDGRIPFINVTYAGFIGSVTGMNQETVSLGEMGGAGMFLWQGTPMAFLMRRGLEEARNLDDAIAIFRDSKRTCEYYYVFGDGKNNRAVGVDGSADRFELIPAGVKHARLPTPVPNTVLLSAGDRYKSLCGLVEKVRAKDGKFTVEQAIRLMDAPVAMKSNLHNVLMAPSLGKLWVAHATPDKQPAWKQKYHALDFKALLAQDRPSTGGTEYPPPPRKPVQAAAR
ncbi:MAG TPA: C45 family peptidase [Planctomycetia bacterium]|nr:C45 family peptidase [Planctomycetia bacterium]